MAQRAAMSGGKALHVGGKQLLLGAAAYLPSTAPDYSGFAAGMTAVPLEISLGDTTRTEQHAGLLADMAGMTAFKTNYTGADGSLADFAATQSGFFDDPAIWGGAGVPGAEEVAFIPAGVEVTIRADVAALKLLWCEGTLGVHPNVNITISIDTCFGTRSARLWIGDAANPVTGKVKWSFPQGSIDLSFDPRMQGKGIMWMGQISIHGKPKTPFLRNDGAAVSAGATSVTLSTVPTGWAIGDEIVFPGTGIIPPTNWGGDPSIDNGNYTERRIISGISGAVISWSTPLAHDHHLPAQAWDPAIDIGNLTRSIVFESPPAAAVHERGHLMFMATGAVDFRFVECAWLGRSDKRADGWDFPDHPDQVANGGAGMTPTSNIKGRYGGPHFHMCGPDGDSLAYDWNNNIKVEGVSVHDAFSLGVVVHSSDVDVVGTVGADMSGSSIFLEAGNEAGEVKDFFGSGLVAGRGADFSNKNDDDKGRHDWGHSQMIWMQSRIPAVRNINCYGVSDGSGLVVNVRGAKVARVRPRSLKRRGLEDIATNEDWFFGSDQENFQSTALFPQGPPLDIEGVRAVGCFRGIHIIKETSRQEHFVYSKLKDLELLNVCLGFQGEYTARYLINHGLAVQDPATVGITGDTFEDGFRVAIEAYMFTVRDIEVHGVDNGVHYDHSLAVVEDAPADDLWRQRMIMPIAGSARNDLLEPSFDTGANAGRDEIILESALNIQAAHPLFTPDAPICPNTISGFNAAVPVMGGTVTDSVGTYPAIGGRDTCEINRPMVIGCLFRYGFWEEQGTGEMFVEVPRDVSDAATGETKKYIGRLYLEQGALNNDPRGLGAGDGHLGNKTFNGVKA